MYYEVHGDMLGYTVGCISVGWGMVHFCDSKQNINAKSSTDTGVVVVSKYLPFTVCHVNYMG